jgi:hypothetical protein
MRPDDRSKKYEKLAGTILLNSSGLLITSVEFKEVTTGAIVFISGSFRELERIMRK